jgi:hypothetical protein
MTARRTLSALLVLLLAAPVFAEGAAKKKKKAKKDECVPTKYRTCGDLADKDTTTYRFDDKGERVPSDEEKKKLAAALKAKKKKKVSSAEDQQPEPGSCGAGEACQDE